LQQINENTEPKVCLNFDPIGLDNNPIIFFYLYGFVSVVLGTFCAFGVNRSRTNNQWCMWYIFQ